MHRLREMGLKLNNSLSKRITFFSTLVVFSTLLCLSIILFIIFQDFVQKQIHLSVRNEASLVSSDVENALNRIERSIIFLSKTPPIQGIVRSTQQGGEGPAENSNIALWKKRLVRIFSSMLRSNPNYSQIRYLGVANNGLELVRVDQSKNQELFNMTGDSLQKKGHRNYFKRGIRLARGHMEFSEISYNVENNKIQSPKIPMIRALYPVYSKDNKIFGLLIINVNMPKYLYTIFTDGNVNSHVYLVAKNKAGFYYDPKVKKVSYFNNLNFLPESIRKLVDRHWDENSTETITTNRYFYVIKPVFSDRVNPEKEYILVYKSDIRGELAKDNILTYKLGFLVFLFCLITSLSIYFITKRIMRRLTKLADYIRSADNFSENLQLINPEINDEVSVLAHEFQKKIDAMKKLAHYDSLTGLPNRKSLVNHFEAQLALAEREKKKLFIMFLDLNKFKEINDTYGHQYGDQILIKFTHQLKKVVRQSDFCARISGDEFAVIGYPLIDQDTLTAMFTRYLSALNTTYDVHGVGIPMTVSGGVALFPDHGNTLEGLISCADTAMYESKKAYGGKITVYSSDLVMGSDKDGEEREHDNSL